MTLHRYWSLVWALAVSACRLEAGELHLKTRVIDTGLTSARVLGLSSTEEMGRRLTPGRHHWLVEIAEHREAVLLEMQRRGVRALAAVPVHGLIVSAPEEMDWSDLGLSYRGLLESSDKLSPLLRERTLLVSNLAGEAEGTENQQLQLVLLRFHKDVEAWQANGILEAEGITALSHSSLEDHDRLIEVPVTAFERLLLWDEVEYIFPAPPGMKRGEPFFACGGVHGGTELGAATADLEVSMLAATFGSGWDGAGRGRADLTYSFGALVPGLDAARIRSESQRALQEWSRVVAVTFRETNNRQSPRNIDILFATGEHGDPFPFLAGSRTLGHAFYPAPPNAEPLAGDIHINTAFAWSFGGTWDIYSVLIHEAGHSLGLGHTDAPGSVMYPYYQKAEGLRPEDIASIRQLYADAGSQPNPLAITITSPAENTRTTLASVNLSGSLENAGSTAALTYLNESNGSRGACLLNSTRTTWSCAAVPLRAGDNVVLLEVTSGSHRALARRSVLREAEADVVLNVSSPSLARSNTSADSLTISGVAQHASGIASVSWNVSGGRSGAAVLATPNSPTSNWNALVPLNIGLNEISIQALSRSGVSSRRSIIVERTSPTVTPPTNPGPDRTAPTMTVQTPIGTFIFTSASRMTFRGTATDNVGVTRVSWRNSAGGQSGEANTSNNNGLLQWNFDVNLQSGFNAIEIRAWDAAGNASAYTATVRRF